MLKVKRKFYCKECAQDVLHEKESSVKVGGTGGINIVNQQTQTAPAQEFSAGRKILTKNHTTAIIISILFGWLGVDRFYVGHTGLGFLKLITVGGYGIWWVIDIILFATKSIKYVRWE
ncbi:TM2 domain-containing protein [archaeon]|nr:TM2 domain-containing protein [archaeon]MBT4647440.1 TM2 domain-containing protein [archaeon]MBT6822391.1 TM2 domain-containing protein [archaeon]MBT7391584.1 TM2 domain-containing protein [archaeon]